MEVMKVFLIIVAIYLALFFISKCLEVKQLKSENQILRNDIALNKGILEQYQQQIILLREINSSISKDRIIYQNIPKDTIGAVKYAMKHAHPDNGGNSEDFIKFKKVYEELANKCLED